MLVSRQSSPLRPAWTIPSPDSRDGLLHALCTSGNGFIDRIAVSAAFQSAEAGLGAVLGAGRRRGFEVSLFSSSQEALSMFSEQTDTHYVDEKQLVRFQLADEFTLLVKVAVGDIYVVLNVSLSLSSFFSLSLSHWSTETELALEWHFFLRLCSLAKCL